MNKNKMVLLGLNELNFEYIKFYNKEGLLPNFHRLFETHGYKETTSENEYSLLEPWIQWVTVHTGKTYEEHQVFRLGDIVDRKDLNQLWEIGEKNGLSIGAISPFNCDNRLTNPKFFVPDPWTKTRADGEKWLQNVSEAVSQAVNDNAKGGLTKSSVMALLVAILKVVPPSRYMQYAGLVGKLKSKVGVKAVILDKLLGDIFLQQWKRYKPGFSSLFLNTGAHFQHHYMFNSKVYDGDFTNPDWYCPKDQDPLLLVLQEYDALIGELLDLDVRLLVCTGLHQKPHKRMTFYWRLKEHAQFLDKIGVVRDREVIPRMSRDFLVNFKSEADAKASQEILESFKAESDGQTMFTVDNRGSSLFVELTYPHNIEDGFNIKGDTEVKDFEKYIAFVAIKNGEHHGVGYFLDTGPNDLPENFPLTQVHDHIVSLMQA